MKPVKDLLSRFKRITPPDDALRRMVARIVTEVAHVPTSREQVSVKNSVAYVKCSSIAKSVIHSKRASILAALARELPSGQGAIKDVR